MLRASKAITNMKYRTPHVTPAKRSAPRDNEEELLRSPVKRKPRSRRTLAFRRTDEDEEDEVAEPIPAPDLAAAAEEEEEGEETVNEEEEEEEEEDERETDFKIQKALDACWKLGEKFKVPTEGCTLNPTEKHLERIFAAYAKTKKQTFLTYSNVKSFHAFGGRLLFAAICDLAKLKPKFEPTGAAVWRHQWFDEPEDVRCFHGTPMFTKEISYRVKADSERGFQALKKGEGELEESKSDKDPPMVLIKMSKFAVCFKDQYERKSGSFSRDSCGVTFSDIDKAYAAAKNAEAFNAAAFPKSKSVSGLLMIVTCCECNYAGQQVEGRQTTKITPWAISEARTKSMSHTENGNYASACDQYPYVFVFQCCKFQGSNNPTGAGRSVKQDAAKPCDFRLSYTDAIKALVLVKTMASEYLDSCKVHIPRFVWQDCWRVKNAITPSCSITSPDPDPFGE